MCNTKCSQVYGKIQDELMESYVKSASEIVRSINDLAVLIVNEYQGFDLQLDNNTFKGTTAIETDIAIAECIMLVYLSVKIPKDAHLSKSQQRPIHEFNKILTEKSNVLYCMGEILQLQSEVLYYIDLYEENGDMNALELAKRRKRQIDSLVIIVKKCMEEMNELYKDVQAKIYL